MLVVSFEFIVLQYIFLQYFVTWAKEEISMKYMTPIETSQKCGYSNVIRTSWILVGCPWNLSVSRINCVMSERQNSTRNEAQERRRVGWNVNTAGKSRKIDMECSTILGYQIYKSNGNSIQNTLRMHSCKCCDEMSSIPKLPEVDNVNILARIQILKPWGGNNWNSHSYANPDSETAGSKWVRKRISTWSIDVESAGSK